MGSPHELVDALQCSLRPPVIKLLQATFLTLLSAPFILEWVVAFEALGQTEPVGNATCDIKSRTSYGWFFFFCQRQRNGWTFIGNVSTTNVYSRSKEISTSPNG
jgi:hypothetical protein